MSYKDADAKRAGFREAQASSPRGAAEPAANNGPPNVALARWSRQALHRAQDGMIQLL